MAKKRRNRAQSQIVSTVILILITIVAAGLIIGFIIPFVKDKLSGGDCLDIINQVEISSGYTCYDDSGVDNYTQVQIHIGPVRNLIDGFIVELGGASSKSFKILENDNSDVSMYNNENFSLPNDAEERTYILNIFSKPDYIKVYPVLRGDKYCGEADSVLSIDDGC